MISLFALTPLILATLSRAADHLVEVGENSLLAYNPSSVVAAKDDTVTFRFHPKNHTATQSSFGSPCSPLADENGNTAGSNNGLFGFNSGFMPVNATVEDLPTFQITVQDDSKPIWFYCQQTIPTSHCQAGMVFAVNAPEGTFEEFKAAAMASGDSTTASITGTASSSASSAWTSPPAPVVETVTATVTVTANEGSSSVYTTTYASWEGSSPNPTPLAAPATHQITVGGTNGLVFTPPTVNAAIGDIVEFTFQAKNHSVTQALFNSPCSSVEKATNGSQKGFDSGFMPVSASDTEFPTFNITVDVTTPIWGYCRQVGATPDDPTHCQSGMVFGINPPTTGPNTFNAFQMLAAHTVNQTINNGSTSASSNSTSTDSSGAGRTAISASLGLGILGALATIVL